MILRIVCSFFFLILVTGKQQSHYGYPTNAMLSAMPILPVTTQSQDMHAPIPIPYTAKSTEPEEKTICIKPSMVHRMVKAALDYVSQMPSGINTVIDQFDEELNRMSDTETVEEITITTPLDSKTVFSMLEAPRSDKKSKVVLKYELPKIKEPHCREALEKLIEIVYTAYMELEQHPQCRDYLYNYDSHRTRDRPTGHVDREPELKSVVATILDKNYKYKPYHVTPDTFYVQAPKIHEYNIQQDHLIHINEGPHYSIRQEPQYTNQDRFNDFTVDPVPQINDLTIQPFPQTNDLTIQPVPQINELTIQPVPQINELTIQPVPQINELSIQPGSQINEYTIQPDPQINEFTIQPTPQIDEIIIQPGLQINEYTIQPGPQINEYAIHQEPQINEFNIQPAPEIDEITIHQEPQVIELSIQPGPQIHEYTIQPDHQINEYTIQPDYQINEHNIQPSPIYEYPTQHSPQIPKWNIPNVQQHEDPIINIIKYLKSQPNSGRLFDDLTIMVEENENTFKPKFFLILLNLLYAQKQINIPRFNDLLLLLLESQKNPDWALSDRVNESLLSYLVPDQNGNVDARIVDILINLYKTRPNGKQTENILSLLRPLNESPRVRDITLKLIYLQQNNLMNPELVDVLIKLINPARNGVPIPEEVDIADNLARWNEIGITPNQLNNFVTILKPYANGHKDHRPIDIIHYLLVKGTHLKPKYVNFILVFLYPQYGVIDSRRIDVIQFLLSNLDRYPEYVNILFNLLQSNPQEVLNSRFLDILILFDTNGLLNPELVEIIISILSNEAAGQLDDQQVKSLFYQLVPYRQVYPDVMVNVLTLLNQDGLFDNIVKWFKESDINIGFPIKNPSDTDYPLVDDGFTVTDNEPQSPNREFVAIFRWLDNQGLLSPDHGSNTNLVKKVLQILEESPHELGAVELTYMLKHEKPLIYQPVYYVKYRLPIISFIKNMKNLLLENPSLNQDPTKLLQELIVSSNVTEVSPNLQGYPKEEILKLTVNDGDLIYAKILDEQNSVLNDQIKFIHGLNTDVTPEELLQLNIINEAKYYPNVFEVKEVPGKLNAEELVKFLNVPSLLYRNVDMNSLKHPTKPVDMKSMDTFLGVTPLLYKKVGGDSLLAQEAKTVHPKPYNGRENSEHRFPPPIPFPRDS